MTGSGRAELLCRNRCIVIHFCKKSMWHSAGTCTPVSGLKNQATQKAHAQLLANEQRAHALFFVGIESTHAMLLQKRSNLAHQSCHRIR